MTETNTYSAALYRLADEIEREGLMTVEPETIREAAERLDTQTVTINVVTKQRDELLAALESAKQKMDSALICHPNAIAHLMGEAHEIIEASIGSAKGGAACN